MGLIYRVGFNDLQEPVRSGKTVMPAYTRWYSMMERGYCTKFKARCPAYADCTVDPRWHRLSVFKAWFDANWRPGLELDKDILVPGNKVYGPDTCVFVPRRVNNVIQSIKGNGTAATCGAIPCDNGYQAVCLDGGKRLTRYFSEQADAVLWYRATKGKVIRRVATDALARKEIDIVVHKALLKHARLIETGQHQ